MEDLHLEACIDDELYLIKYEPSRVDNYAGEWYNITEVKEIWDSQGKLIDYSECPNLHERANSLTDEYYSECIEDYYDENE